MHSEWNAGHGEQGTHLFETRVRLYISEFIRSQGPLGSVWVFKHDEYFIQQAMSTENTL